MVKTTILAASFMLITVINADASGIYKRNLPGWQQPQEQEEEADPGLLLCPDSTYVRGKACVLCVDGTYKGHQCKLGPDGRYY